ncbi:hypothetical protein SETIT_1G208600v2 [Setaria italica]|uniref:Uncharacterized protein n=1 Tax=Setaria italica TaxID=4555 RepID=K3YWS9_SETIT|nr:uncharacterized protein LOC101772060 [Setaria italica]RCV06993.1 hypothetical protein SETIT_1G208600v2 [Setaria italica]
MAPRSRLLDLERHDVLFFYGAYHHGEQPASVATHHTLVFWPVFLVAALHLHLVAPFPHAAVDAAACAGLYVACCFLLDRAARRPSSAGPTAVASRSTAQCTTKEGYTIEQHSEVRGDQDQ